MKIVPIHFAEANAFVVNTHRHHGRVVGYKFAVAVEAEKGIDIPWNGPIVHGVAICGRPVARKSDDGRTLEVVRLATDGTKNICSMLYGACARIAREMGYTRIITYTLETEPGTSLKASGWKRDGNTAGGSWSRSSRERADKHPTCPKIRWILRFKETPAGEAPSPAPKETT